MPLSLRARYGAEASVFLLEKGGAVTGRWCQSLGTKIGVPFTRRYSAVEGTASNLWPCVNAK